MVTYGPKFVAVIEGWLLYRDAEQGGCSKEVAALWSDHYTEVPL